jgi:REP element-mobilizing transposase RayT
MANTYTSLHYHVIFSTKNREPWLVPAIEQRVGVYWWYRTQAQDDRFAGGRR